MFLLVKLAQFWDFLTLMVIDFLGPVAGSPTPPAFEFPECG
jgi:hypothetical protein